MNFDALMTITESWIKYAEILEDNAAKTKEALRTGELPQEDELIYGVYEKNAEANALRICASVIRSYIELEKAHD